MPAISKNSNLTRAKAAKNDEFYTQLKDIENELYHYREHFYGKTVYCNCDDPRVSNFFFFFSHQFERLGLKKLIATSYQNTHMDLFSRHNEQQGIMLEYTGDKNGNRVPDTEEIEVTLLNGDGDFRSPECIALLKQADIVVTNPPFSLFREYVSQLMEYQKQFLIIGNQNAVTYKEIFPLIQENRLWMGIHSGSMAFDTPQDEEKKFGNICWFTNLSHKKRQEKPILFQQYCPEKYPQYDNYNAIEVSRVADIPKDYDGAMGVPITFLDKYNPDYFKILGITKTWYGSAIKTYPNQIQVNPNGRKLEVTKLNDGPVLKIIEPPVNNSFYIVDNDYFVQKYARILIQRNRG